MEQIQHQIQTPPATNEERINNALGFVGLNKNERIIYIDLLRNGTSTALEISKRTHIHRPNTYDSLRKLIEEGFVSETNTDMKHSFHAIEPEKLKDYIRQKEQEIDAIIPMMKEFAQTKAVTEDVWITKGPFALREALLDLAKMGKTIMVLGAPEDASDLLGIGFLKEFHKERIKKKVSMLHI